VTDIVLAVSTTSGVPPYLQLIRQVRHALRMGLLREGDKLPAVQNLAARLGINRTPCSRPTASWATTGWSPPKPGVVTFVRLTLADAVPAAHDSLNQDLHRWLAAARRTGLADESIEALFGTALRSGGSEHSGAPQMTA
jgi:GntR family transcriptional regulator